MVDEPPALRRSRLIARLFDDAFRVPGTRFRFGVDAVVGVLPIAGDTLTGLASLYIVAEAVRAGVPRPVILRMLVNVLLDVTLGSIPLLGTLFDAVWKANARNVDLLERHIA